MCRENSSLHPSKLATDVGQPLSSASNTQTVHPRAVREVTRTGPPSCDLDCVEPTAAVEELRLRVLAGQPQDDRADESVRLDVGTKSHEFAGRHQWEQLGGGMDGEGVAPGREVLAGLACSPYLLGNIGFLPGCARLPARR